MLKVAKPLGGPVEIDTQDESNQTQGPTAKPRRLDHQDYAVGWICALPKEQTAATAMLDQIHPTLPKPPHDQNAYTLGSIGKHNIVIACLPKGQYATIPAAKVATWMTGTFPAIRLGLMVGIGGGMPPKVRLGDVVISSPTADCPGVIQWDLGKAEGQFKRTGFLNNPPTVLLTALAKMETLHDMEGSRIPQYLDDVANRWPNLASKYCSSPLLHDPFVRSDDSGSTFSVWEAILSNFWQSILALLSLLTAWSTLTVAGSGNNVVAQDPSVKAREGFESHGRSRARVPHVHCGLIASGDQVIKNADFRDRLNRGLGGDVLCVEMEAAGLMNDFPCLVIRGICGYADAHKNEEWPEYAAATAAACAKELLEVTDPMEVRHAPEARRIIQALQEIKCQTEELVRGQKQQAAVQSEQVQEQKKPQLLEWLSPLSTSTRHSECQRQRVKDTGTWLIQDPQFVDWSSDTPSYSVLYCHGQPGAGKTIISSLVIDKLNELASSGSRIGVGYIYCDYRDQHAQTAAIVAGTLLRQLLSGLPTIPAGVQEWFERRTDFSLADAEDLFRIISADLNTVYVCLDALDELSDQREAMKIFRDRPSNMQLFVTGRPHVRHIVHEYLTEARDLPIVAHATDIQLLLEHEIGGPHDDEPGAMNAELKSKISEKVVASADGLFLLPVLQIQYVLQNLTISRRAEALEKLPPTLGAAYAGSFTRIEQQPASRFERAARIIAWVHLAKTPLTVAELMGALAVEYNHQEFDEDNVPVKATLLSCCHGLVVIDESWIEAMSTVRLVHYSLQEHLQQQPELFKVLVREWHRYIASTCLTFLNFPSSINPRRTIHFTRIEAQSAFHGYVAQNWIGHLQDFEGEESEPMPPAVFKLAHSYLLTTSELYPVSPYDLRHSMTMYRERAAEPTSLKPIHVASYFGLRSFVAYLDLTFSGQNCLDSKGRIPLLYASSQGHVAVVRLLLEGAPNSDSRARVADEFPPLVALSSEYESRARLPLGRGAMVDLRAHDGTTSLIHASLQGYDQVVRLLLEKGAAVDLGDLSGRTPSSYASQHDCEKVVRLLLEKGATTDLGDRYRRTPLSYASESGHEEVVQLLLENGAKRDCEDDSNRTPLSYASENGHERVVQLLLDAGAIVDLGDQAGRTPLSYTSERGFESIVQLLLERGAVVDSRSQTGAPPLIVAARQGHTSIVRLLLDRGAAVDVKGQNGRTALISAALSKQTDVVELLLERGAAVDAKDQYGWTALFAAALRNSTVIVQLLLNGGAAIDAKDEIKRTVLSLAAESDSSDVVQLLLERGAAIDAKGQDGRKALFSAAMCGNTDVVRLLLERGTPIEARNRNKQTALSLAAKYRSSDVAQLLLERGACVDTRDDDGTTVLAFAAKADSKEMVQLLLDRGAAMDMKDRNGRTALFSAAEHDCSDVVQLLLERGAAVDTKDVDGATALAIAVKTGGARTVQLLLEGGAAVDTLYPGGETMLSMAMSQRVYNRVGGEIAQLLRENGAR